MKQALAAFAAGLAVAAFIGGSGGCSPAASGSDWDRTDIARAAPGGLVVTEVVASAGRPESGVTEVIVTAPRPGAMLPEVVVSARRPVPGDEPRAALDPAAGAPGS